MATGTVLLPIEGAIMLVGDAGNEFPGLGLLETSDASTPKMRLWTLAFDDTQDETVSFNFRLPADYGSGGVLKVQYYMDSSNSGNVVFRASLQAITPGDMDDMESLDPVGEGGGWASATDPVPENLSRLGDLTITLNMDSAAAGDFVALLVQADVGGWTSSGDMIVVAITLEYTVS